VSAAGYSGTPLAKKLGIKELSQILVVDAPHDYSKLVAPLPAGVAVVQRVSPKTDIAHVFVTRKADLVKRLAGLRTKLKPDAAVWVSWPKKASRVPTDITEDTIRAVALPIGFVDIKVCALSDVWSGLKLVVRKNLR
jgi:hypothetical protein